MQDDLRLVCLVPLSMVVACAVYLFRPPGYRITRRDRVRVVLTVCAVCGVWVGARVIWAVTFAPDVTFAGRLARGLPFVGIGLAPLLILKLVDWRRQAGPRSKKPR